MVRTKRLTDTIKEVFVDDKGEITRIKGWCKAKDLRPKRDTIGGMRE